MLENNVGGKNSISREVGKKNSYPNQITHTPPPPHLHLPFKSEVVAP